jgi:hypothetical protein
LSATDVPEPDFGPALPYGCEPRVESESRGKTTWKIRGTRTPFMEVHKKAKAFKDRANEANKNDAELRKSRAIQEANETLDKVRD